MIIRLICPECKKDSFSADAELFKPCPYCGIHFSGIHGTEKRRIHRIHKSIPCSLSYHGKNVQACTINFSENGMSVKISGTHSLPVGDIMDLEVGNSALTAQIMWAFDHPKANATMSGLKILDGVLSFS